MDFRGPRFAIQNQFGIWMIAQTRDGKWHPCLDGESLGSYPTPAMALDDLTGDKCFSNPKGLNTSRCGLPDQLGHWHYVGI